MKTIQIFGMRCSGTNYIEQLVKANFKDVTMVEDMGHKHLWNATLKNSNITPDCVIILVRNPFDWLRSVHREPHHCPQLIGKNFKTFLSESWQAYYGKNWNDPLRSKRMAIVESQNLREEFENVIEMRNEKLAVYKNLCQASSKVTFLRLRDVQVDPEQTIRYIEKLFSLERQSDRLIVVDKFKKTNEIFKPKGLVKLSKHLLQRINTTLDWDQEAFFGFTKSHYKYDQLIQWYRYKFLLRQLIAFLRNKLTP